MNVKIVIRAHHWEQLPTTILLACSEDLLMLRSKGRNVTLLKTFVFLTARDIRKSSFLYTMSKDFQPALIAQYGVNLDCWSQRNSAVYFSALLQPNFFPFFIFCSVLKRVFCTVGCRCMRKNTCFIRNRTSSFWISYLQRRDSYIINQLGLRRIWKFHTPDVFIQCVCVI